MPSSKLNTLPACLSGQRPAVARGWLLLLVMAMLAGCGSSGGAESPTSGAGRNSTVSTEVAPVESLASTAVTSDQNADTEVAKAAALMLSDFPPGWRSTPATNEEQSSEQCLGGKIDDVMGGVSASSDDFSKEQAEVSNNVGVAPTVDAVTTVLEKLRDPKVVDCVRDAIVKGVKENVQSSGEHIDVSKIETEFGPMSTANYGDETIAYQAAVTIPVSGLTVTAYADFIFVRVDRGLDVFSFTDVLSPFTEGRDDLINKSVGRLQDGLT